MSLISGFIAAPWRHKKANKSSLNYSIIASAFGRSSVVVLLVILRAAKSAINVAAEDSTGRSMELCLFNRSRWRNTNDILCDLSCPNQMCICLCPIALAAKRMEKRV